VLGRTKQLIKWKTCALSWSFYNLFSIITIIPLNPNVKTYIFRKTEGFLGSFVRLRNSALSFITSVRFTAWNNPTPTGLIFMKLDIWVFFENLSRKLEFLLHFYKNYGHFTWIPIYIIYRSFLLKIGKGKVIPLQASTGPDGSRRLSLPDFKTFGT
jgi:hypothetical protein